MLKHLAGITIAAAAILLAAPAPAAACDLDPHAPPLAECVVDTVNGAVGGSRDEESCDRVIGIQPPLGLPYYELWICYPPDVATPAAA